MNLSLQSKHPVMAALQKKKKNSIINIICSSRHIFMSLFLMLHFSGLHQNLLAQLNTAIDLSTYVRIGRYDLPEPTRTTPPPNSLLAQEASGVAYNYDTQTLFIVADGGTSIVQVSKSGALINSMTMALGSNPEGREFYDTEGITYVGNGKFVMVEERDRQLVLFTYVAGTTLTRAAAQTVKLGTFASNTGIEGLTYDPITSGFICVKEKTPMGIFQTNVDFINGTATNGSPTTQNSINLFNPALTGFTDMAEVYALSNIPGLAALPNYNNLIVLGQENAKIVNISRTGVISSTLTIVSDPGNPLSAADQQHEGLVMDEEGILYVVSENGGGDINHPQLWVYAPPFAAIPGICPGSNINFSSDVSGSTYQWQVDIGNAVFTNLTNTVPYSTVSTKTLNLTGPASSLYGYKYRCVVNGNIYSNTFTLKFSNRWTGTSSSAWETAGNWSCGTIPDANTDVYINSGTPNAPMLNSTRSVRSIQNGSIITIADSQQLNITGH